MRGGGRRSCSALGGMSGTERRQRGDLKRKRQECCVIAPAASSFRSFLFTVVFLFMGGLE